MACVGRMGGCILIGMLALPSMVRAQSEPESQPAEARRPRRGPAARDAGPPPVTIENATILSMSPQGTFKGTLVLRRGKIAQVQQKTGIALGMGGGRRRNTIDADGKFVTPGLIDAASSLALAPGGYGSGRASFKAADAVNSFDRAAFEEALRGGVTAVCIEPHYDAGFVGTAALIRLENLDDLCATTRDDVCLVARTGLGVKGPFARLSELAALRKTLEEAKAYRESIETYEEELEAYLKALKEGKTVKLKKKEDEAKPPDSGPAPPPPEERRGRRGRRPPRPRPPRMSVVDQVTAWLGDAAWVDERPVERAWFEAYHGPICDEEHVEHDVQDGGHDHSAEELEAQWQALLDLLDEPSGGDSKSEAKAGDQSDLARPQKPDTNADSEVLVRALKHEIPIRFEVHHAADVQAVLKLIDEFNLKASLSGVAGAAHVSDAIGEAAMTVLLDRSWAGTGVDRSHWRPVSAGNAKKLAAAGAPVVITSGRMPGVSTAYLSQIAAMWAGGGLDRDAALRAVTIEAARACGMDAEIGSIEKDKRADVVIWSDHPLRPDAVVERVFVGGREVYRRPGLGG